MDKVDNAIESAYRALAENLNRDNKLTMMERRKPMNIRKPAGYSNLFSELDKLI